MREESKLILTESGNRKVWSVLNAPGGMVDIEGVDGTATKEEALAAWKKQAARAS